MIGENIFMIVFSFIFSFSSRLLYPRLSKEEEEEEEEEEKEAVSKSAQVVISTHAEHEHLPE